MEVQGINRNIRLELKGCNFTKKDFLHEGVFNIFSHSTGKAAFKNVLLYPSSIFVHVLVVIFMQFFQKGLENDFFC